MKMKMLFWAALLLLGVPGAAFAQQTPILCNGTTACNTTTGPSNTGTGDPLWKAYGKVNANETQLYSMFGVTGVLKGNGTVPNALTLAGVTDILSAWTGTKDATHCAAGNGTMVTCAGGGSFPTIANQTVVGNGSGSTATSVALTLGGNLVASSTGLLTSQTINTQSGTSYTVCAVATCSSGSYTGGGPTPTDAGSLLTFNNASAVAVTLAAASTTGFTAGFSFDAINYGAGNVTITPTTSTIGGASSLVIPKNASCTISSDGTNYQLSACTAKGSYLIDTGAKFTLGSGTGACATTTLLTGGTAVGSFKCTGTGGASTQAVTFPTAPNGWVCDFHDMTTTADVIIQSVSSTTSATASGTVAANDVIAFKCAGF